jgi:hypothetical protein
MPALGPGPGATAGERVAWWAAHYKTQKRAGSDWRRTRLDRALARAIGALIAFYGRGQAMAVPPSRDVPGWRVLVDPRVRPGEDTGQLVVLATLGDAVPFLRDLPNRTRTRPAHAALDRAALADAWGALEGSTRPVRPEVKR